jgi:hypothetical protein
MKEYTEKQIEYIEETCNTIGDEEYREWLDEVIGEVQVGNLTFDASRIIEELDPIAFRCGFSDYTSSDDIVEINNDYYRQNDVDDALEDYEDEESEVDDES